MDLFIKISKFHNRDGLIYTFLYRSSYGRLFFRHFNELDHELHTR